MINNMFEVDGLHGMTGLACLGNSSYQDTSVASRDQRQGKVR